MLKLTIFTPAFFRLGRVLVKIGNREKNRFAGKKIEAMSSVANGDHSNGNGHTMDEGDVPNGASEAASKKGGKKRLSVERIYQKKTQLEHILLR